MMDEFFKELAKVSPGVFAAIAATAGAAGAITAAVISGIFTKLVVTPFLGARDKQDREVEWRKHAIELTKLELERKLKSGRDFKLEPLRPAILDFLANYRELQELGEKSPKELYEKIKSSRISPAATKPAEMTPSNAPALPDENDG